MFLSAFGICNAYKNIRIQRDEAREDSRKGTHEWCDLHTKLRDTQTELCHANEKLQDADSEMDEDRREFRNTIQALNDQHLFDQEKIRSLEQDVWNTESDRDGYRREVIQFSKENERLKQDLSEATHQRDLAQCESQTLREDLSEAKSQRDLAQAEVQTLSIPVKSQQESQQGQATSIITTLKARPKPQHRRTQRPSSLPRTHKKLVPERSNAARPSTSFLTGPKSPRNLIGENFSQGMLQEMLVEKYQTFQDLQEQIQAAIAQNGAEADQMPREKAPEVLELEASNTVKDRKISGPEQKEGTLTAPTGGLRTDSGAMSDDHGECNGHLYTELAEKDEEIRNLQAKKTTADKDSAETIATLRTELGREKTKIAGLEQANERLVAESSHSADTVQRLNTLSKELEVSRLAHAQCGENSVSQNSKIGQLVTAEKTLEETLRIRNSEVGNLQGRVTVLHDDLEELRETHARCSEHASTRALEMTGLRNAHGVLQGTNANLLQRLETAEDSYASLIQEHQRMQNRNQELLQGGQHLQSTSQREIHCLQGHIETLNRKVDNQQQSMQTLKSNCPRCQKLREALDEALNDVEMSDDNTRAELKREITVEVREELRSQVADDVRRRIRGEVEHELRGNFQKHYSKLLATNSSRIKEQDRLLLEKDSEIEKARNAPSVNHAACAKKEAALESAVTKLQQDAKIAKGIYSRLCDEAKHHRQQLDNMQAADTILKGEFEMIKADQRRQNRINPLQGQLTRSQREVENMKIDRDKARNNCSEYSKLLSDLRKKHKALEDEHLAFRGNRSLDADSMMDEGRTEEPVAVQDEQRKEMNTLRDEVARLSKELQERQIRNNVQSQVMEKHHTPPGNGTLPVDEAKQEWREGSFPEDHSPAAPAMDRDEAAALDLLLHEVAVREARDGKIKAVCTLPASASPTIRSGGGSSQRFGQNSNNEARMPIDRSKKSDDELEEGEIVGTKLTPKPARRIGRRPTRLPARHPTTRTILGEGAGLKRVHHECSDGEADDEGDDDRKKVKITVIEDGMHRLEASGQSWARAQDDKAQIDKDME